MGGDDRWAAAAPPRQGSADDAGAHAVTDQEWRGSKWIPATVASSSRCAGTAVAQQWRGGEWSESCRTSAQRVDKGNSMKPEQGQDGDQTRKRAQEQERSQEQEQQQEQRHRRELEH